MFDPEIRFKRCHCFKIAITITNGTGFDTGASAGVHIGGRVAYHEAIGWGNCEYIQ